MKTLHFTNYWHGTSGGIARFYSALLDAANRHEQEMRLVVPSSERVSKRLASSARSTMWPRLALP